MAKSRLELRPAWAIVMAYLLAPLPALLGFLLIAIVVPTLMAPDTSRGLAAAISLSVLFYGELIALIVELVIATPLLLGFRRYRWAWLNGWSAAAIGLVVGALMGLAYGLWLSWGVWTMIALAVGAIGMVTAVVFRFLVARRDREPN